MNNEELVLLYQQGNSMALEMLIENNIGFINKIVNKFYTKKTNSIDKDDLIQEGRIGLMIAARKYNFEIENRASFTTYSFHWIYKMVNQYINKKNTNEEMSINISVGTESDTTEFIDIIDSNDKSIEYVEEQIYLIKLRKELEEVMRSSNSLRETETLKLYFGWDTEELSLNEIGDIFQITGERVRQIKYMALRKIRKSDWMKTEGIKYKNEILSTHISYHSIEKNIDFELSI